ncbi:MAG: hypothetical protein R3D67_00180 [Hyphomicrobiaceae bacterium]
MMSIFGFTMFFGIFGGILWANARRWRKLAESYAGAPPAPAALEERNLQSAVLLGLDGVNSLKGIVKIGVYEAGVSLRIMAPFSLFHAPLFIPYVDIQGWATSWYLDARSTELAFRQTPEVKIVMPAEQAEWIRSFAGHKMTLRETSPPDGKAGQGWRALALIHAALSLVLIGWLCVHYVSGLQF